MVIVKWLRKNLYFVLLGGMGVLYLSQVDHWQVYEKPLMEVLNLQQEQGDGAAGGQNPGTESGGVSPEGDSSGEGEPGGAPPGGDSSGEGTSGGAPPEGDSSGEGEPGGAPPEGDQSGEGTFGESAPGGVPGGDISPEGNPEGEPPGEPVYMTVEDDYFQDAVFIGDSRTVGMFEYGGLEQTAAFYASTGLTVYKMFDAEIVTVPGEKDKITVEEALQQNSFAKIYLMIGINEMGIGTVESFLEKYREALEHLKELQPNALIYLQAIMKVSTERSAQGDYINNEGIEARNQGIALLADNVRVFYLDVNPLLCDETGGMEPSYTFDGVHLKAKYIEIWKDYLKSHAISP